MSGIMYPNTNPNPKRMVGQTIKNIEERGIYRSDAVQFIESCGLKPTPDAVDQLMHAFIPALQIMCDRGYDPQGNTWKEKGWRGLVHDILNKAGRLRSRSWLHDEFDKDSAIDMINFCGFYVRMKNEGKPWGTWGEPSHD